MLASQWNESSISLTLLPVVFSLRFSFSVRATTSRSVNRKSTRSFFFFALFSDTRMSPVFSKRRPTAASGIFYNITTSSEQHQLLFITRMYTPTHTHTHTHIYTYMTVHTRMKIYTNVSTHTHTNLTCVYTHVCTQTYSYTHNTTHSSRHELQQDEPQIQ
jgi:hypothetical protein